ncbi:hypothetical protein [Stenotrophomonas sp. PS02300]|uniref:hypothetical protein n=1 Tax=Stenotrophomonas sp. PS02300 TaxID=2991426 RepID=UPI00249A9888|nr:hypothetical protein [Stenotrophomonas sp. PS02300]
MEPNYKRVRRALQNFSLEESLTHIWQFSRLLAGGVPLPPTYQHIEAGVRRNIEKHVFPHELDLLARELLLHASRDGKPAKATLATWNGAAMAFNAIKEYGNGSVDLKNEDVMLVMHRLAHQQMPRFSRLTKAKIGRYLALYRFPALEAVFERRLGIAVDAYFALAFAVMGSALRNPRLNTTTDFSVLGIDLAQSKRFFERIVGDVDAMTDKMREEQQLNSQWEYTLNAFHFFPLIALDRAHMERAYCPLPPALEARLIEGIFFDIFEKGGEFDAAYGGAVEAIVGRMLSSLPGTYTVTKPKPKAIGKQTFHGSDWVVENGADVAYIECKAKRIALKGRVAATPSDLAAELQYLADAVVQNYANMLRDRPFLALSASSVRAYCLVVTLEDWLLFSDTTFSTLHRLVVEGLVKENLPSELPEVCPYFVLGAETLQYCVAALASHTFRDVFGPVEEARYRGWAFGNYLRRHFPGLDDEQVGGFAQEAADLFQPFIAKAGAV